MQVQDHLNSEQLQAVLQTEGPVLVLAGAGSGKTRIITYRIAHLLELGVPASEILAVTFTNKAAEEMRQRIHKIAGELVLTCTFHSFAARLLRESISALGYTREFSIFDEEDTEKLLKECSAALNLKDEKGLLKEARAKISQAKNNLISPEDFSKQDEPACSLYQLYQSRLKQYNAVDFDDLLFLTVKLFREFPAILENYQKRWTFLLIDEYQDTNGAQYLLIKYLSALHHNVFAVGDPDQSIYSWRGANIHNILNFEKDYPGAKIITLEQNYRSQNIILQAANSLIRHNMSRYQKNLWSNLGVGDKIGLYICDNEHAEAQFVVQRLLKHHQKDHIPLNECVIFYRTNFQSRVFEDALLKEKIPYVIIGGLSFYQRKEIKDILAFLRLALGGTDFLSFTRTINLPKRGMGESTIAKLRELAQDRNEDIFTLCTHIVEGSVPFKLSQKQETGLREYVQTLLAVRQMLQRSHPLPDLIRETLERSRYLDYLKEDPDSYEERRGNVEELISKAAEWSDERSGEISLSAFLEELSLKSSLDEKTPLTDCVKLMTFHNGKGLEFKVVFLVGMEEDLFPHANSRENEEALEEERRLCYVGMTRAKQHLYFTASRRRFLWGASRTMRPSRFLQEIPSEYLQAYHAASYPSSQSEQEEPPFSPGDAVVHKDFGVGLIQKAYHTSLGLTYDVLFPRTQTTRTLVAKYAKLSLLEN